MEDISRVWWIGYGCTFVGGVLAIAVAAWCLLPRPEAPLPPPPPPLPVATVEAPPPEAPVFMYPEPPHEPVVVDLLSHLTSALAILPPFRVALSSETIDFRGATTAEDPSSGGEIIYASDRLFLVKGNRYRMEAHVTKSRSYGGKVPYDAWEVSNGTLEAKYKRGEPFIEATSLQALGDEADRIAPPLHGAFVPKWKIHSDGERVRLAWSVVRESSGGDERVVISGRTSPDSPYQHVRCELVLDPARDYLIVRESYWMDETLREEKTNVLQQLPDGRWFPERSEYRQGERRFTDRFTEIEMGADIDDQQFEMESIPCDLDKILARRQTNEGLRGQIYLQFIGGYWKEVKAPRTGIRSSRGTAELAQPKE